jgi:phosphonate transport system permease protein
MPANPEVTEVVRVPVSNTAQQTLCPVTRSSVILGLVGAGGIGLELKVAMDLFDYPRAATIILIIFVLVVVVEQIGSLVRGRVIEGR